MNSFAPGDYVEATVCVHNVCGAIHRGQLYRVSAVLVSATDCQDHATLFPGDRCPRAGLALYNEPPNIWCVSGFRHVHRPDAGLFARLMAPVPAEARDDHGLPDTGFRPDSII